MSYDYPPEFDTEHALEVKYGFLQVAWTENDDVYIRKPWAPHPDREDGYQHVGKLEWDDDHIDNESRLTDFVQDYKDRIRRETGETFVPPEVAKKFGI